MFGLVIVTWFKTAQKQKPKNNKLLVGWPLDGRLGQEEFQQNWASYHFGPYFPDTPFTLYLPSATQLSLMLKG
jgi:hypothetical protein